MNKPPRRRGFKSDEQRRAVMAKIAQRKGKIMLGLTAEPGPNQKTRYMIPCRDGYYMHPKKGKVMEFAERHHLDKDEIVLVVEPRRRPQGQLPPTEGGSPARRTSDD